MQTRIPPPVIALLSAVLMAALDRLCPLMTLVPVGSRRWGIAAAILGFGIVAAAMLQFRQAQTTTNPLHPERATHLVATGLFRVSRNPMYVGLVFVLSGCAIGLGSLAPWLGLPVFVTAVTRLQIVPEERVLTAIFGAQYAAYCSRVGRWITFG